MSIAAKLDRKPWLIYLIASAIVLFRTLPMVIWGNELLDSDEAFNGLMTKWWLAGHPVPIFEYGQKYQLAIYSWLAAPLFKVFGPSTWALRTPILLCNILTANLLLYLLRRDSRLSPTQILLASLFFLLPSFATAKGLMNASSHGVLPFLFILLIWVLRKSPLLSGIISAIGVLNRPFVLYGAVALAGTELLLKRKSLRDFALFWAKWIAAFIPVYAVIKYLGSLSPYYFGTSEPGIHAKQVRFMLEDVRGFFAEYLPQTIGLQTQSMQSGLVTTSQSHFTILGFVLAVLGAVLLTTALRAVVKTGANRWIGQIAEKQQDFLFFLFLTGTTTFFAWDLISPPCDDIRYLFTVIFGLTALVGFQRLHPCSKSIIRMTHLFIAGLMALNFYAISAAAIFFAQTDAKHPSENVIRYLLSRNLSVASTDDYWNGYKLSFLSNEAVRVTPGLRDSRLTDYEDLFRSTPANQRATLQKTPCPGGEQIEGIYVCPTFSR